MEPKREQGKAGGGVPPQYMDLPSHRHQNSGESGSCITPALLGKAYNLSNSL